MQNARHIDSIYFLYVNDTSTRSCSSIVHPCKTSKTKSKKLRNNTPNAYLISLSFTLVCLFFNANRHQLINCSLPKTKLFLI